MHAMHIWKYMQLICTYAIRAHIHIVHILAFAYLVHILDQYMVYTGHIRHLYYEHSLDPQLPTRDRVHI